MESRNSNTPEWQAYSAATEPDASVAHQRIRAALLSLPKETCPVGIEFRLMKRIEGKEASKRRPESHWVFGWAGAGMGVAVAMIISFAVFDFSFAPTETGTIATSGQENPTAIEGGNLAAEKSATIDQSEAAIDPTELEMASTPEDSAAMIRRGEIPAGLDQKVSTGGR